MFFFGRLCSKAFFVLAASFLSWQTRPTGGLSVTQYLGLLRPRALQKQNAALPEMLMVHVEMPRLSRARSLLIDVLRLAAFFNTAWVRVWRSPTSPGTSLVLWIYAINPCNYLQAHACLFGWSASTIRTSDKAGLRQFVDSTRLLVLTDSHISALAGKHRREPERLNQIQFVSCPVP